MDESRPPPTEADRLSKFAWARIERTAPPKRAAAERVADFLEIYFCYDEDTVQAQASRCIQCPHPSCVLGCPLSNRIPEWLALAADGRFLEAAAISRTTSNMPEICSRVCPQERLCEGSCILNGRSEPVAIGAIECFINEYALRQGAVEANPTEPNGRRVAVIGSGPAGIACADELAKLGYAITLFEAQDLAGGLLVNGLPSFKLEKTVVDRRLDLLRQRGVVIKTGVKVGWDVSLSDLRREYDAVFLGVGAQQAKPLGVPGSDLPGVQQALPFLCQRDAPSLAGKRVIVLGGGDTAMDCLRTAIRRGADEALCLYRRDFANMPGSRKEYANAIEEGARFQFLTNPVALEAGADGSVGTVRCQKMELGAPDAGGRRQPKPIAGSELSVPADLVVAAYGFDPVPFPAGSDFRPLARNPWGGLAVDANEMTNLVPVFAGGDSTRGPSLVVHAVRDGRQAAAGIHRYLQTAPALPPGRIFPHLGTNQAGRAEAAGADTVLAGRP